jgi:filamentous hemagglutinin family protein
MFRFLYLPLLCLASTVQAEISINNQQLSIKNGLYDISQNLGQTVGNNLFHSFDTFNLNAGEIAQFSGSNSIQNIISRVIGGEQSFINGTIRSTILNADFYFLNPYGIVFGESAQLDLQGSFHASTADYIKLSDGGEFHARFPERDILTTAPIASFGFLTDAPTQISTQSSKLILSPDKTLSLIGGDIHLNSDTPLTVDHTISMPQVESQSILAIPHGQINLVSLASSGEVKLAEDSVELQGIGGEIKLDNTFVHMSGDGGGAILIRAAQLKLDNSVVFSDTLAQQDGKDIDIRLTEAAYLNGFNTEITMVTASTNRSGNFFIDVPYLEMNQSRLGVGSIMGQAGDLYMNAQDILLQDGASLANGVLETGYGGNVYINATNRLSVLGRHSGYQLLYGEESINSATSIVTMSVGSGNAGNIEINAKVLNIVEGSISSASLGVGRSGNMTFHAQQAYLMEGATISNSVYADGETGYIKANITDKLHISGKSSISTEYLGEVLQPSSSITSLSYGIASGGMIDIQAGEMIIEDTGDISASSFSTGDAGDIFIQTNKLLVSNTGIIETTAENAVGGNINVSIPDLLYLHDGIISTSVHGGSGDGGNIYISNPQFLVMNQSSIIAQAYQGQGGNIRIAAEQFVKNPLSLVSASSQLGIDGNVQIDSPTENVSSSLLALNNHFVEQVAIRDMCQEATKGQLATEFQFPLSFKINTYHQLNDFIEDWIPSVASQLASCN